MEYDKKIEPKEDLFVRYSEEITPAYHRAVREALLKHKRAGNPVPIERDGKIVYLKPEDIEA
ncbi:MAG TPA: hypothetical protein PKD24_05280 [Pyrinomonadaceae bacterium]|mgnify:CR=1 FL=1|nr:hypothetical protein [Pyrinomonadaceae bacterium]HMP64963.1 hypothetical protein [Pyrinomonadaceae bacterium]